MEPAILIPTAALRSFSPATQTELMLFVGLSLPGATASPQSAEAEEEGPVELTVAMVRKITAGLSDKTTSALRAIAQSPTNEFRQNAIIAAVEGAKVYGDLRGVYSALTRRIRNVINDPNAELIWWNDGIYNDEGEYVDHVGHVSPMTHTSLKTHFGL